jgi:uncharacterized membrane protein YjgN (DUF898 family)
MSSIETLQAPRSPASAETIAADSRLEQRGTKLEFLPQAIVNAALVIVSFNVYLFWAKVSVRRYLWSTTWLGGAPLRYTGNGNELALGFLRSAGIVLVTLGLPIAVLVTEINAWLQRAGVPDNLQLTGNDLIDFIILLFLPFGLSLLALLMELTPAVNMPTALVAICAVVVLVGWFYALTVSRHLAFAYLLRHTCWQGVRGEIPGSPWVYGRRLLLPELSRWLTLGWTGPWRYVLRWDRLLNGARFGGGTIKFRGRASALYPRFAFVWVALSAMMIGIPPLIDSFERFAPRSGLSSAVGVAFIVTVFLVAHYNQQVYRHVVQAITVGELRFRFTGTRRSIIKLYLTNLLMNIVSSGLAYYYTRLRIARYVVAHTVVEGDPRSLIPAAEAEKDRDRFGEGLEALVAASYL